MTDDGAPVPPMTPAEWKTMEKLVDLALDLPPDRRAAFIADACAGNTAMRAELERFIEECEHPDALLDQPAAERFASLMDDGAVSTEVPGILSDRFRIEREIGRGGMGVVYLARDLRHERQVAVKVMRTAVREQLGAERFLGEIRTTANLHHPHIVPLYDSGVTEEYVFFVMPFVDGESLAARITREGTLSVADAIRIARDIASALEYAHAQGVIHRDVKPPNVLLSGETALLADFGIARADRIVQSTQTGAGVTLGTPAYMSPEQATDAATIDARSDIYSLGCVLYEMLSGERPSPATIRVETAAHGVEPVRPLVELRRDVPVALAACVARAMAIAPADRFENATELLRALNDCERERSTPTQPMPAARPRSTATSRRLVAAAGLMAAASALAVAWYVTSRPAPQTPRSNAAVALTGGVRVDTSVYVLFPPDSEPGLTTTFSAGVRLRNALDEWHGITVLDKSDGEIQDALSRHGPSQLRATEALAIARQRHAGHFILSNVSVRDGETLLDAGVYDSSGGVAKHATAFMPRAAREKLDSVFAALARGLLFPDARPEVRSSPRPGTSSRPALQAFGNGRDAIDRWDLARADSEFTLAQGYDARFAQAYVWLAQVHWWQSAGSAVWRPEVVRADKGRAQLSAHDRKVMDALLAYDRNDKRRACALWKQLTKDDATDFSMWYSLLRCQMSDTVVERNARSPSSWAFRSSFHQALISFQRAFEILPTVHTEFRESWYRDMRKLLRLSAQIRAGASLGAHSIQFLAYPSWSGDTLAFVPYPFVEFSQGLARTVPTTYREAIAKQRAMALKIATGWRHAFRNSPEAMLTLAVTMDGLGYSTALDSVRQARIYALTTDDKVRTGAAEVWMRVKRALPNDVAELKVARLLADSLLRLDPAPKGAEAKILSSLAALTGHAFRAAALARLSGELNGGVPDAVTNAAQALLVFAAIGGPRDSLIALEQEVRNAIGGSVADSNQAMVRAEWLTRAATIAFPSRPFLSPSERADSTDFLLAAQAAWQRHDRNGVRGALEALTLARRPLPVEELKFETLYPEAWLLDSLGDPSAAIARLDPTFNALARRSLESLPDVVDAATLVRALSFRATLARALNDLRSEAIWKAAVTELWTNADSFLKRD